MAAFDRWRRLRALMVKETLQIVRDPSSILIALVLPLILLFLFGYGVSLDATRLRIGVALETTSPRVQELASAFRASRFFDARFGRDRRDFEADLVAGRIRGIVVVPADFDAETAGGGDRPRIQVITDGSEPNTARFVQNYVRGVVATALAQRAVEGAPVVPPITAEPREPRSSGRKAPFSSAASWASWRMQPASTVIVIDSVSISRMRFIRSSERPSPPSDGTAPPAVPLWPPITVIGTPSPCASRTTAATSP